jgi:TRAP-type C4-dicarboxylate transport system permease large subunit
VLAIPALILPVVIVMGVRFGAFTATEAGAIAFVYAMFCGAFLYRKLTRRTSRGDPRSTFDTVLIVIIIAPPRPSPGCWPSSRCRRRSRLAGVLVPSPWLLLLAINVFLLIVGLFMEMIAALVILVPILVPLVVAAGSIRCISASSSS